MHPLISSLVGIAVPILFGGVFRVLPLESFSSLFQTLAAVSAAIIGYLGLNKGVNEWKHQYRERTNSELAKKCLVALYSLRDEIQQVRNPFIPVAEMQIALKEFDLPEEKIDDREVMNRSVYRRRWQRVIEARSELESNLLEAEAEWGKEAKKKIFQINNQVMELFAQINLFLDYRKDRLHDDEVLYNTSGNSNFDKSLDESISIAEDFLRSRLIESNT